MWINQIFVKTKKPSFLGHLLYFLDPSEPLGLFFKNQAPSFFLPYNYLTSCKKPEKTEGPVLEIWHWEWMVRQMHGRIKAQFIYGAYRVNYKNWLSPLWLATALSLHPLFNMMTLKPPPPTLCSFKSHKYENHDKAPHLVSSYPTGRPLPNLKILNEMLQWTTYTTDTHNISSLIFPWLSIIFSSFPWF